MAVLTNNEVFNFVGASADIVSTQGTTITALIAQETALLEAMIGRKVEKETIADDDLYQGFNCEIHKDKMYLKGKYRDLYSITELTELGVELSEATTSYANGYKLDSRLGILYRIGSEWNTTRLAYKVSGDLGLVTSSGTVRSDIKQILLEMVSAKSGLWKMNVSTEGGDITTIRTTISDSTKDMITRYTLRGV